MNFLEITRYGNTIEAYAISIAIFISSLFIARFVYHILRKTLCEWVHRLQTALDKQSLIRVAAFSSCLIPILAFAVAKNRLFFDEEIGFWLNISLAIAGQITFLLVLIYILEPIVEVLSIRAIRSVELDNRKYLKVQTQAIEKIKKHIRNLARVLLFLVPAITVLANITVVHMVVWGLPLLIVLLEVALCLRIVSSTQRRFKQSEGTRTRQEAVADSGAPSAENDPDLEIREDIVEFFLNIYRHQLRALKDTPAEFHLVDSQASAASYIYELRVKVSGDWQSRRMSIGRLGEDTGSRSKCFYVIYDDHLVVKIPPTPIGDLEKYMEILEKEKSIVRKLVMEECIIPSVSVILKMIQRFSDREDLPSEELEKDYVRWLNVFSEAQKYLKIGDTFVFFMDLSKYYFLGHILKSFHTAENKTHDEICRHSEIAWDFLKFENRYGSQNISIFEDLKGVYSKYESGVRKLHDQYGMGSSLSRSQIKKWFFVHLARNNAEQIAPGLNPEFSAELQSLTRRIITHNLVAIGAYRETIKNFIRESTFTKNKAYIEGTIANLLDLLAHLREKGVAMRDLKPDNLLVAGDRERFPSFLAYPKQYKIGLIDVETAVINRKPHNRALDQPLLGGTPQYATPSHLFNNQLLRHTYEDASLILHLQDWYAIVAIIYKTVAGAHLFETTAQLFPTIVSMINGSGKRMDELSDTLGEVTRMFWGNADVEFATKMANKEDMFKSLNISIPEKAQKLLKEFVLKEKENIIDEIEKRINSQDIAISSKDCQYLLSCSYEKSRGLRKKWESRAESHAAQSLHRSEIVNLLQDLEKLKLRLEPRTQMLHLLAQSNPKISAYELLQTMFNIVLKQMHKEEWGSLLAGDSTSPQRYDDSSSQTTVEVTREWQTVIESE
jgi:serine/threonine protein kinase